MHDITLRPSYSRVAVKIGSNVLTRPDGSLDVTRMSALVDQVATLRRHGVQVVVISSGAVASGRSALRSMPGLELPAQLDPVTARQLYSSVGQARLINRYYELFRDHSMACGQVLTMKENFSTRTHYLNQKHCMEALLQAGVVPIVNENDTVSVTELMFTDNDELSGLIATMMNMEALIILSNVDGLYTGDPADSASTLIRRIAPGDDASEGISARRSSAGRGGMGTKYRIASKVASEGIAVIIASGKREGVLPALLGLDPATPPADVPHTLFEPSAEALPGVKKWIAHSEDFAKGVIRVNSGAAEALRQGGASLLPVGVTAVEGTFDKDDIVRIACDDGSTVGWGRAQRDAEAARAEAGRSGCRPLVHADFLYIE